LGKQAAPTRLERNVARMFRRLEQADHAGRSYMPQHTRPVVTNLGRLLVQAVVQQPVRTTAGGTVVVRRSK
jgi:hypothetical protein